ncbi:MAG: PQQ-binding-like beta-propeller repeat protein [Parabacteroides sp.]
MNKDIYRNIAAVTAVFIITLSVMLITNYFQVRGITPLQTEVVETLKELNDTNADNPVLQEQIRQLDLLARRAYFIQEDHLKSGVYILLGMVLIFVLSLRFYFKGEMHIPDKEIDPIDEWMLKSKSRRYLTWGTLGLVAVALLFVFLSSPLLKSTESKEATEEALVADSGETDPVEAAEPEATTEPQPEVTETNESTQADATETPANTETPAVAETAQPAVSKVTSNAFRGNQSNGISSAKGIPTQWNLAGGNNILWKKPIPRAGHNSPVINGNRVFFTGGDKEARELFCYDITSGEQLWSMQATNIPGSPATPPAVTEDTGLASSSVATDGKHVCAIFATGDLLCADMEGKRVWAKNLGVPDNHYGFVSSLLIYGNTLYVQYDNNKDPQLFALDVATGNSRWVKKRTGKICWSSPIIAYVNQKPQLVLMGNPKMTAYDPNSGEQLWEVDCMGGEVCSCPASADGVIYGANEYAKLVAINGTDGQVLWESTEYLPEVSSPVATKNHLYLATSYGVLASYDAKSGALVKEHELNEEFYSSPMIVEGKLYLFSNNGKLFIFSTDENFTLINSFETGERTLATPAFTDGKIVVRTEESIYCVAAK